jgi:hypothetical protein
MKTLMLITILLLAAPALAGNTRILECTTGQGFESFRATLDYSGFDPGSGYFSVGQAAIIDNYANAQLTCAGHRVEEIDCIGFWFGTSSNVVETKLVRQRGRLVMVYESLKGNLLPRGGGWPCRFR